MYNHRKENTYENTALSTPPRYHHPGMLRIFGNNLMYWLALLYPTRLAGFYRLEYRGGARFRGGVRPVDAPILSILVHGSV